MIMISNNLLKSIANLLLLLALFQKHQTIWCSIQKKEKKKNEKRKLFGSLNAVGYGAVDDDHHRQYIEKFVDGIN